MATAKSTESDLDLREEFDTLRKQVTELLSELQSKGKDKSAKLADKLEAELGNYQDKAGQKLQDAYDTSSASLNEVGEQIRRSPVASLLVAFGAGYVLSRLLGSDSK
ncbi:MAG: hypothetical protein WBL07_09895 [Thiothrix litoralis]|jgi:ElaB/YqjD/DUF883 family membrane-anchored ribosome-binding protein|uniref:DUF883 family protein n=1 Tax=Thiothrix litoralis TaxID=2891210 RepID=UPI003C78FF2C